MKDILYYIVTPAPGMMHIMDKPGSCGNFDTYQRPEGFPVGMFPFPQPLKALSMNKEICENVHLYPEHSIWLPKVCQQVHIHNK